MPVADMAHLMRSAFPGPARPAEPGRIRYVGQAKFDGVIALFALPRSALEPLLPPGLQLAWCIRSDLHPAVYLFGEQGEGALRLGERAFGLGLRYPEVGLAVPFVQSAGSRYLHTYMAYMATPHEAAAWSGERLYGYGKQRARVERHGSEHRVLDPAGRCRVRARAEVCGEWGAPGERPAALAEIHEMFQLPIVGRTAAGLVGSYFDWGLGRAQVRRVHTSVEWLDPPIPGIAAGEWVAVEGAAFEVHAMRWRVSWPGPFRA